MSQPRPGVVTRKQAICILGEILIKDSLPTDPKWKQVLSHALKDFAATYCDLSFKGQDLEMRMHKDAPIQYWDMYFVLSLRKILKDLPANTEDLRKATRELFYSRGNGNAARGNSVSPAAFSVTPATLNVIPRTNVNTKKRLATDHDNLDTPNKSKRAKTEAGATTFTVHAKGPYTVRVFEGDIPVAEFSSSTPATVQVKMVQKSAAPDTVIDLDESDN